MRATAPDRGLRGVGGFSIIDVMASMTVLTIGLGAVASTLIGVFSSSDAGRETRLALDAAQSAVEDLRGEVFAEVFARFNGTSADDPVGGLSPGNTFAVPGLRVRPEDPDGFAGAIVFPGDGIQLREDFADTTLGTPRDLSGDGMTDSNDHSGDYVVLPVRVRVEWTGKSGHRELELATTLTGALQ